MLFFVSLGVIWLGVGYFHQRAIAELKAETDRLRLEIGDAMDPSRKLH